VSRDLPIPASPESWLPQGVFVSRYFARRQTVAGVVLKLAPGRPSRPARAAHAPGPTAGTRKASAPPDRSRACARSAKTAPAASESPAQGRQFYADETPMRGERRRLGLEGRL
jgi:hypothetical protein